MRCRIITAATMLAALENMPDQAGRPTGKAARDLKMEDLLRLENRMTRYRLNHRGSMTLAGLVAFAAKRRRAAQGKPGKRR